MVASPPTLSDRRKRKVVALPSALSDRGRRRLVASPPVTTDQERTMMTVSYPSALSDPGRTARMIPCCAHRDCRNRASTAGMLHLAHMDYTGPRLERQEGDGIGV